MALPTSIVIKGRVMTKQAIILIVDDNETNRNVAKDLIVALEHTPVLSESGISAMNYLGKQLPDVVLLDILMPEMDGYEVLKQMKGNDRLRNLPVIMISAIDNFESAIRCIEMGADDYLTKPFNHTLLKARISSCLEKKLLRDSEQQLHKELQENYDSLKKAEHARDAMTHMIVHDLRNPLTIIQGYTQLLQQGNDDESRGKSIQRILAAEKNMSCLIKSILDFSKLESGEMPVSISSLNISLLINDVYEQFVLQAKEKNIQLSIESASKEIMAMADKELLSRILQNLINNGLKHTDDSVTIVVVTDDKNVIISVNDNGSGIPDEYKDKIFDKYFQIEAGQERKIYGVGLGLAFCKMAIEAQKGSIWVESEEGKGSSFKVKINMAG
ncbi:MAG: hybrid sensor histidine kinase/response regulator [Candidatus Anammoxibacter sp.]